MAGGAMHSHKVAPDAALDPMSGHRAAEQDHFDDSGRLPTRCRRGFDLNHAAGNAIAPHGEG